MTWDEISVLRDQCIQNNTLFAVPELYPLVITRYTLFDLHLHYSEFLRSYSWRDDSVSSYHFTPFMFKNIFAFGEWHTPEEWGL